MLKLFSNRSIAVKLAAMTVVGAVCMALVAATVLLIGRSQLITERTEKAHAIVEAVWQLADGYHQMAVSGKITEEEEEEILRGGRRDLVRGAHQLRIHL